MRPTAALFATLTLLCTVFLAQAVPFKPSRNDAEACARLTECDSCVHASRCGFSLDTQSCATKEGHLGRLATSASLCKKATAIHAAREWYVVPRADKAWAAMETHVLDGRPDKAQSGRHLTSTWFDHVDNKATAAHMTIDAATALARVPLGKGPPKTLWIDNDAEGKATSVAHKYTREQVAGICKAALAAALKAGNSKGSVTHGSYAVKTPWGNQICVKVTDRQCYPLRIEATTAAPGTNC
ncbi:uncharacterized protein B0H18DRAFT_1125967 [Fomitopsis serialis]|uniref:uncharacterized protein n=1 Tax=Fomitopsis serialis TaxID=139415 RepID=UPI00200740B9|nr:uncharacterized protein B0H18DRAFT_1125967 [Neoantrodia serialis]KAH9913874.1 hypothetical protein B0H18DRAFT_1125967 [Neoantrodia serialis]